MCAGQMKTCVLVRGTCDPISSTQWVTCLLLTEPEAVSNRYETCGNHLDEESLK